MSNSTGHNSLVKNELNTERDHPEPNLFNNSISYDQIREKSKNFNDNEYHGGESGGGGSTSGVASNDNKNIMEEIMKNLDNLKSTETDMKFEYLANPDKLVPNDQIKLFDKQQSGGNHSDHRNRTETEHYNDNRPKQETDYPKPPPIQENTNYNQGNSGNNGNNGNSSYNATPRPSSYGPSYGEGPSIATGNTQLDQYYGFGSEEELNLAKLDMLRKLGELAQQYGVKLSQNYNMNSDYKAMKYEFELHKSIRDKHNGVKWLSNMMLNICWGVQLANENFNPFEFHLKGWSEQMSEDIDEYYDVLGELYEKYFKSGKPIPPELKLVLMIGGSAVKFHIAHTALGKIPSLNEALLQNPALAQKLNEQAVSDKIKEQYTKQKESFDKKSDEQHTAAKKKAEDLLMLKEKQAEFMKMQQSSQTQQAQQESQAQQMMQQQFMQQQFMQQQMMQQQQQLMQQQILDKQKQLEELQKQLNQQRSDSRSMYTSKSNNSGTHKQKTMPPPVVPASLKNKFSVTSNKFPQNEYNMGIGAVLTPDQFQETMRQQQIMLHKKQLQDNEYNRNNVNFNPNVDSIINEEFNDNKSRISDDNNSNESKASRASKGSKKSRKKPSIKIDT